jgi:hypothetical protein
MAVIRIRRGLEATITAANLPLGELVLATDTGRQFYGTGSGTAPFKVDSADVLGTNAANGLAKLNGSGILPTSLLPALAITDVYAVADIPARDALVVQEGDVAIVASDGKTYIYDGSAWLEITAPGGVVSVNGETGVVTLSLDDISDVAAAAPTNGQALVYNGTNWVPGANGVSTFTALTDTPSTYAGSETYFVRVNAAGTELEFTNEIDGGTI